MLLQPAASIYPPKDSPLLSKEMAAITDTLSHRPGVEAKLKIARAFFQPSLQHSDLPRLSKYFAYYEKELELLHFGNFTPRPQARVLAPTTHADIVRVVQEIRKDGLLTRPELRQKLSSITDDASLDELIDLTLRVWLMLNVRNPGLRLFAPQTPLVTWTDHLSFSNFLTRTFPTSRWQIEAKDSLLHPKFTAAFMVDVCRLRLEWTDSLADHLRLDRGRNILRVFTDKHFLQTGLDGARSSETQTSTWLAASLNDIGGILTRPSGSACQRRCWSRPYNH
jgi:hypothetical protein